MDNPWTNFTHIGVVTRDIDRTVQQYVELGMGPFSRFELPSDEEKFTQFKWRHHFNKPTDGHKYKVAAGKLGPIFIEIFQPISGDSIPQRFLDTKGEGVWHYGYDVEDMDAVKKFMNEKGYSEVGAAETVEGIKMYYFGTEDYGGVYFQAHEVPPKSDFYEKLATVGMETAKG